MTRGNSIKGTEVAAVSRRYTRHALALAVALLISMPTASFADEGGVSFWLPGLFGSLAATPLQPGPTFSTTYYHTTVSAGGDVGRALEIRTAHFPLNLSGSVNIRLDAAVELGLFTAMYAFPDQILGGQLAVGAMGIFGRNSAFLAGTLNGAIQLPGGAIIPFSRSDTFSDAIAAPGDLYPQIAMRWNFGVHNFLAYATGDIPVGSYDSTRLANIGIGHGAFDAGGGYTYFNPEKGHELSAVLGLTYNFKNPSTQYQNGVDLHLDWGASQFLSKNVQVGAVGYFYKQIGCDHGTGDRVGCFQSQVIGIGPQIGFVIPLGDTQAYLNLKGYKEFDAKDRPHGWNAWVTLVISSAPPQPTAPATMSKTLHARY
jgi:hypothetical protein